MQCNIDAKGKRVRLMSGIVVSLIAAVLLILAMAGIITGWWVWVIAFVLAVTGAFQIYEARQGWCIMRAMGFKTPL